VGVGFIPQAGWPVGNKYGGLELILLIFCLFARTLWVGLYFAEWFAKGSDSVSLGVVIWCYNVVAKLPWQTTVVGRNH
jgi:hypothetical protein